MSLPNFLIIGAPKCGTTALYAYLKQHPEVFMSAVKEPRFFGNELESQSFSGPGDGTPFVVSSFEKYRALFNNALPGHKALGEASPSYLYNEKSAEQIKQYLPQAKLIAFLRHPVERAYSHFLELIRDGREPLRDFAEAVAREGARTAAGWHWAWHYANVGYYYPQLKRFYDRFPASQIKVYLYEEFNADPQRVLQDIYRFLGIEERFRADTSIRHHVSGIPKSRELQAFLEGPSSVKRVLKHLLPTGVRAKVKAHLIKRNLERPKLSAELKHALTKQYLEDFAQLEELIGRDLSHWRGPRLEQTKFKTPQGRERRVAGIA